MKAFALVVCCFVAGIAASLAIATPPPGKGKPAGASTSTTHGRGNAGKVTLCHRTGSKKKPYVRVRVSKSSVKAHLKQGDVEPAADGSCPKPASPPATTTTA